MARNRLRTRRAGGTGAIYKDGNGYRAQVVIGYRPETGDPIVKKVRTATHKEAVDALTRLQHAHRTGKLEHSKSTTLADFVATWLADKIEPFRAPKTAQQYRWVLTMHVLPILGRKRLDQIRRHEVQALASILSLRPVQRSSRQSQQLEQDGYRSEPQPQKLLSRRTVRSAIAVLHSVFEDAIKNGLCSVNPCYSIDLPKALNKPAQFLEPKEVGALLLVLKDEPVAPLIRFLLATGTRSGEARGLRWQDVDLDRGIVRICGQLQSLNGKLQYLATTKTNQDRRLPIPNWLVDDLKEIRARQLVDGVEDPDGIVFLNVYGRRIHESNLNKELQSACRRAQITIVSTHKLRHTAATLALLETGDLHAVQKLLGHQQVRLTSDLYGHATAERLRPVSEALGRILAPENWTD